MVAQLELGGEWVHQETGDRIPEGRAALADVEDPDAYFLEKTCPECGDTWLEVDMDSEEFAAAGMETIHVPCASEAELRTAIDEEQRVIDILEDR